MNIIKELMAAANREDVPETVRQVLHRAAHTFNELMGSEHPDTQRLDFLEDLGHFLLIKPDGCDYRLTIIKPGEKEVIRGETLRKMLDEASSYEWEDE